MSRGTLLLLRSAYVHHSWVCVNLNNGLRIVSDSASAARSRDAGDEDPKCNNTWIRTLHPGNPLSRGNSSPGLQEQRRGQQLSGRSRRRRRIASELSRRSAEDKKTIFLQEQECLAVCDCICKKCTQSIVNCEVHPFWRKRTPPSVARPPSHSHG